jgi:hypothetical protein
MCRDRKASPRARVGRQLSSDAIQISAAECYPDRLKEPVIRKLANVAEKKLSGDKPKRLHCFRVEPSHGAARQPNCSGVAGIRQ